MNEILSMVLGSMHADMARMDRVAMNLANLQTPGYKREVASAIPFAAQVEALGSTPTSQGTPAAFHTDQRAGTLKATGQSLDLALSGGGWFEVSTPQGIAHTRNGNFRLDARGRLVTQQGYPVMGQAGEIQLPHGVPVIDSAGRIFEGTLPTGAPDRAAAAPLAQLKVVRFERGAAAQRLGDGLLVLQGESAPLAEGTVQVQQGFLENSNVGQMQEMVQLMESMRHMETMQKVAIGYDEMLGTAVRRLGEAN